MRPSDKPSNAASRGACGVGGAGRLWGRSTEAGFAVRPSLRRAPRVRSAGTFNGRYFEITFTSSAFRNRNWRCAMLTSFGFSWPRVSSVVGPRRGGRARLGKCRQSARSPPRCWLCPRKRAFRTGGCWARRKERTSGHEWKGWYGHRSTRAKLAGHLRVAAGASQRSRLSDTARSSPPRARAPRQRGSPTRR